MWMDARRVMVALAVTLALGCGGEQSAVDAGGDAQALDVGAMDAAGGDAGADADAGAEVDAGWCVSEPPCIQRINYFGVCREYFMQFPCDDGSERTYDDVCSATGVCGGTACECSVVAGCCDGCTYFAPGTACTTAPPFNNPASCTQTGIYPMTFCNGPPVTP